MELHIFTSSMKALYWNWQRIKINILGTAVVPWNVNKMSSSTCLIPCIHHEWENIEINYFNWSLAKVIQRSFGKCDFPLIIFQKPNNLDLATYQISTYP